MCYSMARWRSIDRGHYRATTWVLAPLTLGVVFGLPREVRVTGFATAALMALFLAAVYSQRPLLEWASALAAVAVGVLTVAQAAPSELHAALGILFLGAVTHGMILGHWYLNQPRLPIEPLKDATNLLLVVILIAAVAGLFTRTFVVSGAAPGGVLLLTTSGIWWGWLVLMVGAGVLAVMIRSTVKIRSTQSATGLYYLAMLPAFAAQFVIDLLLIS